VVDYLLAEILVARSEAVGLARFLLVMCAQR